MMYLPIMSSIPLFTTAEGLKTLVYMGPETLLPLASILAAVVGFLLLMWRYFVRAARKLARFTLRKLGRDVPLELDVEAAETAQDEA